MKRISQLSRYLLVSTAAVAALTTATPVATAAVSTQVDTPYAARGAWFNGVHKIFHSENECIQHRNLANATNFLREFWCEPTNDGTSNWALMVRDIFG